MNETNNSLQDQQRHQETSSKRNNHHLPPITPKVISGPPLFDPNKIPISDPSSSILNLGSNSSSSGISSIINTGKDTISSVLPFQLPGIDNSSNSSNNSAFQSLSTIYQDNAEKLKKFRFRIHWGLNNLVAYCSQTFINIFDPISLQQLQSLYGHRHLTTCVEWCDLSKTRGIERGNSNILASGDEHGFIIIWDIKRGKKLFIFHEESGNSKKNAIVELKWLTGDVNYLLSLSSNSCISLWNTQTNNRVWKLEFSEPINHFHIDPFTLRHLILTSDNGGIFYVNDLNVKSQPVEIQRKLQISGGNPVNNKESKHHHQTSNLKSTIFSSHTRNQIFVLTKREITCFDLTIKQPIVNKSIKGVRTDFQQLFTFENDPNLLYTTHEDGTCCVWEYNGERFESVTCDVVRSSKNGADRPGLLYGLTISPIESNKVIAISADGKLWTWDIIRGLRNQNKWILNGIYETTSHLISSLKVSPFNDMVAVGTINGLLLVYDLLTNNLKVKHDVFNNVPLLGIRWFDSNQILCFTSSMNEKKKYKKCNELRLINLESGKHHTINVTRSNDPNNSEKQQQIGSIKGIRVSNSYKYFAIILQDKPIEIWRLDTLKLIRMIPFTNVTALEWCPLTKANHEMFYFTTSDGSLHFYRCENYKVDPDVKRPKLFAYNQVTALAWKNDLLVAGDSAGNLTLWELSHKKTKVISTHRGMIRKIVFSREHNHILILFTEGDFCVYDLDQQIKVSQSPVGLRAVAVDWARGNYPVIATNAGSILVFDLHLNTCNSNVLNHNRVDPIKSSALLPNDQAQYLRAMIENGKLSFTDEFLKEEYIIDPPNMIRNGFGEFIEKDASLEDQILSHRWLLPKHLIKELQNPNLKTAERCLLASTYFGDKIGQQFWKLAIEFLTKYSQHSVVSPTTTTTNNDDNNNEEKKEEHLNLTEKTELEVFDQNICLTSTLPATFDLLRDNESVRNEEMKILQQHDDTLQSKLKAGVPTEQVNELFPLVARSESELLQKDQAVKVLLQTPLDSKNLYQNYLHACVLAASNSPNHFKETVQFVSSSLISLKKEDDIQFGVQLLCSIGEGLKACRILQDFDMWEKAARIAKCILPEHESIIILTRWADHLQSNNQLLKSIGVWMSLGLFKEVLDLLHKSELDDIASLFTKAYDEYIPNIPLDVLHRYRILKVSNPTKLSEPLYSCTKNHNDFEMTCRKLKYFVYQQYAVFLDKIGYNEMSNEFKLLIKPEEVGLSSPQTDKDLPKDNQQDFNENEVPEDLLLVDSMQTNTTTPTLDKQESWVVVSESESSDLLNQQQ
ncbi:hypothetical protein ABK040_010835 [Willaertia magna]